MTPIDLTAALSALATVLVAVARVIRAVRSR
jgi:hypothetical protein